MLNRTHGAITLSLLADSLLASSVQTSHAIIQPIDSRKMCASSEANRDFCQQLLGSRQVSDKASIWASLFYRLNPQQMSAVTTLHKTHIEQRQVLQQTIHQHRHQHNHSLLQQHQHWHLLSIGTPIAATPRTTHKQLSSPITLSSLLASKANTQTSPTTESAQSWLHTVTQNALPQLKIWTSKRLFKAITPIIKQAELLKTIFSQTQQPTQQQQAGTPEHTTPAKATMISRPLILNTFNPYSSNGISYRISRAQRLSSPIDMMQQVSDHPNLLKHYNRQYFAIRQLLPYQISRFLGRDITTGFEYKTPLSEDSTLAQRAHLPLIPHDQNSRIQDLLPFLPTPSTTGLSLLHRESLQKTLLDKTPSADTSFTRLALSRLLPMLSYNTVLNNQPQDLLAKSTTGKSAKEWPFTNLLFNNTLSRKPFTNKLFNDKQFKSESLINISAPETPILKTVFDQLKQAASTPLTLAHKAPALTQGKHAKNEARPQPQLIYPKNVEKPEPSVPKEPTKTKDDSAANVTERSISSLYNEQGFSRQLTQKLAEDVYQLINQKIRFEKRRRGLS
ncbi:hypothetical protein [Celerinatantimonas diazotrophica]|uniref:Uncharacterized protein n=1 Tax=Celerinatantimonas diazotrophica TaxID=412034 RepID=A0A4R1J9R4_9GAMM|nr:hypothetical protein [Celerinatantimonas diazotrophica]TCK47366.1 hypothetical protein EV690_2388 [Celerinatantimonas diazotrophica]CAG9295016.1 hypothetical protein CEDIAZO_00122 [Celerinatantimonas diazotrophica]